MPLEHHALEREFPDDHATMHELLQHNVDFARLAAEYHHLDTRIYEVEDGRHALDDLQLHSLKMKRVALKDEIAQLLRAHQGG